MLITYRRVGTRAVLPALIAAGVLVVIGGLAAMIAVAILAVVGVIAFGMTVLRALGLGGRRHRSAFRAGAGADADKTIEGVVVTQSSPDGDRGLTLSRRPPPRAEDRP
jgi:hypothetical protein